MSQTASGGYPQDYYVTVDPKKNKASNKHLTSAVESSSQQTEESKIEKKFGSLDLNSMDQDAIRNSIEQMGSNIHQYETYISRKISKHYAQLRPMPHESQKSVDNTVNILTHEIQLQKKLITFQENQIKEIQETEKDYDSRQNIEFDIPLKISQTKKGIQQLQSFIHIAHIKQKKKSEDLVKVDKTNLQQFQRTAMLRTNLEVAMLYEINLNERQMKIDDHMYEFNNKIDRLDKRLEELSKIVEEKHIIVSSNKHLIILKQKKGKIAKKRQEQTKRLMLLKHTLQKQEQLLVRDKQKLVQEIKAKEKRFIVLDKEIGQLSNDSSIFLKDKSLETKLRKSISFNYAQTLLTVKDKKQLGGTKNTSQLYSSMEKSMEQPLNQSILLSKPNFKVKRYAKNRSMNSSMQVTKKDEVSTPKKSLILPVTIQKNPEKNDDFLLRQSAPLKLSRKESKAKKSNKYGDEFDLISDD